ncbi:Acetyltransferase (GNAT) family protein [Roseivivax sp. THAF40]|uniref:GNAT family N-acetyltransferase n=1 Tax=unclassified Roseivivax TaxID=2639302 RepID=UPI001267E603|nr:MULTISPECIES: GNAT family protein [unclassified Roseivivax]QFS81519.1 Acetyltransferase (GNAT) family protein [Roseivivax sp. THAF197b]QFT45248.1 Acetyltransferase (GNAT) family protein [Roseivivax sp. THAF40]
MSETNAFGQPVGARVTTALPCARPGTELSGRTCRLTAVHPDHADGLFAAYGADADGRNWTYLPLDPPADAAEMRERLRGMADSSDPLFVTILDAQDQPLGTASYLRIDPEVGSVEVGGITYSPRLQRRVMATEAMYLMMRQAFELGYRRYEWKCDALNAPSRRAAERLGFTYEGTHRQARVNKGRNRDTAWFSILDHEWPARKAALEVWLAPENFDAEGRQKQALTV